MKENRTLYDYYVELGRSSQQKNIPTIKLPQNNTLNQFKSVAVKATSYDKYIEDDFDFNKLNRQQLSKVVQQLSRTVNRRFETLERVTRKKSPAYKSLEKSGGKISIKGKTLNELRYEYVRAKNFLSLKTSTVKGFNKVNKELANRLGFERLSQSQIDDLWEAYNKLDETKVTKVRKIYSSEQNQVDVAYMILDGKSVDDIITDMNKKLDKDYEVEQERRKKLIESNPMNINYKEKVEYDFI